MKWEFKNLVEGKLQIKNAKLQEPRLKLILETGRWDPMGRSFKDLKNSEKSADP